MEPIGTSTHEIRLQVSVAPSTRSPSRDNLTQPIRSPILNRSEANDLKSTSLIMRTIKSASQFDEAMKNLAICDRSSHTPEKQPTKNETELGLGSSFQLVSSLNSSKSSSSSSILYEDYAKSKDDIVGSFTVNFENNASPKGLRNNHNLEEMSAEKKPIAAPRIKKIGPSTGLNLQLSQLRRIYEAADKFTDNNGREFDVGDVQIPSVSKDQPDEYTTELSGSWSRVKARRNMIKQQHQQYGYGEGSSAGKYLVQRKLYFFKNKVSSVWFQTKWLIRIKCQLHSILQSKKRKKLKFQ